MWDVLLKGCHAATMRGAGYGAIRDAVIALQGGQIAWIGPAAECPSHEARRTRELNGAWVTPGLIDCHTHLIFGGNRAHEWEQRLNGASYEEIARAGGGIVSTVKATRAASEDELVASGVQRARRMTAQGATTIEIKSGYGLDPENEWKMLRAAARVGEQAKARIERTFLGAHSLPPEFANDRKAYVDLVCQTMIPEIAKEKLAEAVDVFCETIAFTPAETERIFAAAKTHGLGIKIHAEQLSNQGAAALAARFAALSADHLEHLDENGVAALARAGTLAVLLPCAFYFLRETRKPPLAALRRAGVPIAIATDCNPGTSPSVSPLLALNMACTLWGMTPEEALAGMTRNAARALGRSDIGILEAGRAADLAVWNISEPSELAYWMGGDLLQDRYFAGRSDKLGNPA
ncbi:MAG TPA: imidazolonepropionase [Rhizomicrobium sp.]|nr:imidazolonepropionase [Rhizomicrobium sp.]